MIQRAKAKKNYAKVLKEEGMASNRLGVEKEKGKGRERVGLVKDPYAAFKKDGAGSDSDDDEEEDKGTEVELMKAGRKRALSTSPEPASASASTTTLTPTSKSASKPFKPTSEMRRANRLKGKEREIPLERSTSTQRPVMENHKEKERAGPRDRPTPANRREVETPEEKPPSLRGMKKEAFAKRYPVNPVVRGAPTGRGRGGSFGAGHGHGRKGQPNMGARMGVLLEAIKRGSK